MYTEGKKQLKTSWACWLHFCVTSFRGYTHFTLGQDLLVSTRLMKMWSIKYCPHEIFFKISTKEIKIVLRDQDYSKVEPDQNLWNISILWSSAVWKFLDKHFRIFFFFLLRISNQRFYVESLTLFITLTGRLVLCIQHHTALPHNREVTFSWQVPCTSA